MTKTRGQSHRKEPEGDLGSAAGGAPLHSHIAALWESEADLAPGVDFLEAGLRNSTVCVVIGDPQDNERVLALLRDRHPDVDALAERGQLKLLERAPSAEVMLRRIEDAFDEAMAAGASRLRLFGVVVRGGEGGTPDAELLRYEARLTELAEKYVCSILCLHQGDSLTGQILREGVLATHSQLLSENEARDNPFFISPQRLRGRLEAVIAHLSERQEGQEAMRRQAEMLQAIFDNIPLMIGLHDPAGGLLLVNREWERTLGWTLEEARRIDIVAELYPDPERQRKVREFILNAEGRWADFKTRTRDGRIVDTSWVRIGLSDGTRIGFGQDVTERKRAEEALQRSYEELRALSERLRAVREDESARIAREIHDELGQLLTALKLDVSWMERHLGSCPPEASEALSGKLQSMALMLDAAADVVQRIATELRPGMLDELGLEAAVEWYVDEFQKRTAISCRLRSNLGDGSPDRERSTALFRILQEALTNVARHAEATEVEIRLAADDGRIVLAVADNGRGIPEEAITDSRSLGLLGMRERARALGGDVVVRRASPKGTAVEASVPA